MRFGSLFAGIGGLDLGLERAGMTCAWQVEIDDYCTRVLTKHWPNVPKFRDVRQCGKENLEPVDLICGGFPCQPFSVVGRRLGSADGRHLWPEMLRIIDELRPAFVLGENVPGLIPMALDTVLDDLEAIDYQARAITFPAASLGAWHRRERLWIMANSGSERRQQVSSRPHGYEEAHEGWPTQHRDQPTGNGKDVSYSNEFKLSQSESESSKERTTGASQRSRPACEGWWQSEPNVGRVAHGVPRRVDRLRALGNAVVPQCAEFIGRAIMAAFSNTN